MSDTFYQNRSYYESVAANSTSDGIMVQSLDGTILWCNPAYCTLHGRTFEEMVGRNPLSFALPLDQQMTEDAIEAFRFDPADPCYASLHQRRNRRSDGEEFWIEMNVRFEAAPSGVTHAITICRNATMQTKRDSELDETRKRLEFLVSHDSLTGIANHLAFIDFIQRVLGRATDRGELVGVLRIDLDRFKSINDTHGHAAGDAVLVRVAQILHAHIRPEDLAARLGGDEFVVVCTQIACLQELETIAAKLCQELAKPFVWRMRSIVCTVSIGVALSYPGQQDYEQLLQQSDFALYEVKRNGRGNSATFDKNLHDRQRNHQHHLADFAEAVMQNRIIFEFQPVLSTITGAIAGLETLARWNHPSEGPIEAGRFLGFAGELGLLADLDKAAVRAAIDMKHRLTAAGHKDVRVGFNASIAALTDEEYISSLLDAIATNGFSPDHFVVEILETVILEGRSNSPLANIERLARSGLEILLDDFGNGHAGLVQLAKLPLTGVKIDQTLVADVGFDPKTSLIVSTLIELCQQLGLNVVVEGVEDLAMARKLSQVGSRFIQGFWLSKPMTPDGILALFETHIPETTLLDLRGHTVAADASPPRGSLRA
jgi:diguanylate cyclase (GGDEF)-like protein/PAS domain S-box-containing protein